MMRNSVHRSRRLATAALAILLLAPAVTAQEVPGTVRGLENFSLQPSPPTPTPTPTAVPSPSPTPSARATPPAIAPVVPAPVPEASATPAPRATPTATSSVSPTVAPAPDVVPTPLPAPIAPSPVPRATVAAPQAQPATGVPLWAILGGALVLGGIGLWLFLRRRAAPATPVVEAPFIPPAPPVPAAPEPVAPPARPAPRFLEPTPAPPAERARIDLSVTARRAGVNLVTATADVEVTLHNAGEAAAVGVRLDVRLLSAHAGQDAALDALFASAIERTVTPAFDLAPGERRTIRTLATLPRTAINVLTAGDRAMFVPVLAVNAVYAIGAGTGQTAAAYAIGIERDGAAKLAPFRLDGPTRMYETVAVRPHAVGVRR